LLRLLASEKLARPNSGSSRTGGPSDRVTVATIPSSVAHAMLNAA
jgi:hypothetical protein